MSSITASIASPRPLAMRAATLAWAGSAAFAALLALLHVLEPEFDPSWRMISEYALGRFGWLMVMAFAAQGTSYLALGAALTPHLRGAWRVVVIAMLLVSATGMFMAAIFTTDPVTATVRTPAGRLHELGATLDLVPLAAALVTWRLWRAPAWRGARRTLLWITLAMWAVNLTFVALLVTQLPPGGGPLTPDVKLGWAGRLLLLSYCTWVIVLARRCSRLRAAG